MISIRTETTGDRKAVRRVIVDAFTDCEFGHNGEADLVDQLHKNCDRVLSLVAIERDQVVGHILFSPVTIQSNNGDVQGMGLAPMAVAPNRQRNGIGKALIESGITKIAAAGFSFVVVLGHPQYYPKFGFFPAAQIGISHGFGGIPQDVFFIKILDPIVRQSITNSTVNYRPEFYSSQPE